MITATVGDDRGDACLVMTKTDECNIRLTMIDFDCSVFVSRAPHGSDNIRESKYGKFFVAPHQFLKISQAYAGRFKVFQQVFFGVF